MSQTPNIGNLAGKWTYRSFQNDPDLSAEFNSLEFGRGAITIEEAPMGVLKGTIGDTGWSLDLNGSINCGHLTAFASKAKALLVVKSGFTTTTPLLCAERQSHHRRRHFFGLDEAFVVYRGRAPGGGNRAGGSACRAVLSAARAARGRPRRRGYPRQPRHGQPRHGSGASRSMGGRGRARRRHEVASLRVNQIICRPPKLIFAGTPRSHPGPSCGDGRCGSERSSADSSQPACLARYIETAD